MALSVFDPISSAIERTKRVCFRPFDLGKWFIVGFCAFLTAFAEGGASVPSFNFNFNFNSRFSVGGPGGKSFAQEFHAAIDWLQAHLPSILLIGLLVLIVVFAIVTVLTWLGSRGQFMFIDNIVRNRAAVAVPWSEYRKEANSAFLFRFLFALVVLPATFAIPLAALLIALPDIRAERFGQAAIGGLIFVIAGVTLVSIVSGLVTLFLNDFVVPIMYLRRIGVMAAWGEFRTSMLAGHAGSIVLYVLFKIVFSITFGLLMSMLVCCTLCIAAIPYLGSHVLLLPMRVFWRSYSLSFVEQFGPQWQLFRREDELTVEPIDEETDWYNERIRPGDERIRPADDFDRPPDDRFRPG